MLLQNKKIAIIGAGPVGLTMARLLQQKGIEVTVYERDKDAQTRVSGGTLDLHKGSGQDALKEAGLLQKYYEKAVPMGRTITDKEGKTIFSRQPTADSQYENPEINRNDLRKLLLDSLKTDTVVWDRKFTNLKEDNGKWLLEFENGINATADLIIGANGGMSKVRQYVTDAAIEYTGTMMIQGEVLQPISNEFYKRCNGTILMTAGKGNLLVANPKNGNVLSYNVIFKKPEESELNLENKENIIAFLLARFSNWNEVYKQLFQSTAAFKVLQTRKIPLDKPWKINRPSPITLIGDAAHIMPPFAGQGVNTGLKDALILSENLTNGKFETIEAAIKNYEQQMFVYAREAQNETRKNELEMWKDDFSFGRFYE